MKICLKKTHSMCSCNEYNLIICCDGCIGRRIRRNLPKCICGDGVKINIIVTGCDGILEAPALPCNDLITISSPIKVIRKNPCCGEENKAYCDCYNMDEFDFDKNELNKLNEFNEQCSIIDSFIPETINPQEFAIIVRSFNPAISQFLCQYPQMYITDCDNTIRLIIIFDKNGSIFAQQTNCNSGCGFTGGGGCGCGFGGYGGYSGYGGGCGFGGCGCGFGGLFGIAALALLFCC